MPNETKISDAHLQYYQDIKYTFLKTLEMQRPVRKNDTFLSVNNTVLFIL